MFLKRRIIFFYKITAENGDNDLGVGEEEDDPNAVLQVVEHPVSVVGCPPEDQTEHHPAEDVVDELDVEGDPVPVDLLVHHRHEHRKLFETGLWVITLDVSPKRLHLLQHRGHDRLLHRLHQHRRRSQVQMQVVPLSHFVVIARRN